MTDAQILDIFYKKIVHEAQKGKVDCYFTINIAFNLIIDNIEISKCIELPYDDILIPTLKITNKKRFDDMLIAYVKKAINFYDPSDFSFLNDMVAIDDKNFNQVKAEYLIKYIISNLFANASFSDFNYPIEFLRLRLAMFDNRILNYDGELELGYIDSIGARIYVTEQVSPIKSETPYSIRSYLQFDDGYKLFLPDIYAGNSGDKYKLYGIQKTAKSNKIEEEPYLKQIRRGFIAKINGAPEHYFLTVMLFLSLCSDKEIEIIPFLVERWNAKTISIYNKSKNNSALSLLDIKKDQNRIQNNITNILILYFEKLEKVSKGINFHSLPFELDSSLYISIEQDFESRSIAFNEIFGLVSEYKNKKNNLGK
ncbi:MAG: hypothetical protein HFI87_04220 [Bacilli bacterium]|nr:hypothetical protein [Bacilli bacterium]